MNFCFTFLSTSPPYIMINCPKYFVAKFSGSAYQTYKIFLLNLYFQN